jgi:CHAD domain-containing protein
MRQMDKLIDLLPLILHNADLLAVNRMRVTCRRLEQILDLVYVKPRPRYVQKMRRQLKSSRRLLGDLRDCDALLAVADSSIAENRPEADAWLILRPRIEDLRSQIAWMTLEKLGRVNLVKPYLRVKRDLALEVREKSRRSRREVLTEATSSAVYEQLVQSLDHRWRKFSATVENSHKDPSEPVIHGMRIAAKRLRCLTEIMAKLHIAGSFETLNWLRSLQRAIGVWHDLEITEKLLRRMLVTKDSWADDPIMVHMQHIIRENREIKKKSARQFFALTRHSRDYQRVKKWAEQLLAGNGVPPGSWLALAASKQAKVQKPTGSPAH